MNSYGLKVDDFMDRNTQSNMEFKLGSLELKKSESERPKRLKLGGLFDRKLNPNHLFLTVNHLENFISIRARLIKNTRKDHYRLKREFREKSVIFGTKSVIFCDNPRIWDNPIFCDLPKCYYNVIKRNKRDRN